MSLVPEIKAFRKRVNKIGSKRDATLVKVSYLTASRVSEIVTVISPSDRGSTKPYGTLLKWRLDDYENHKALVLKVAVLKRKKEEVIFKNIGLPCERQYEPWTVDLLKYIKATGSVTFGITRQRVRQIIKRYFPESIGSKKRKNILRHYRLTHLSDFYGLSAEAIITYAGWTFSSRYRSGQLDTYVHLDWGKYFPKLLKKLG